MLGNELPYLQRSLNGIRTLTASAVVSDNLDGAFVRGDDGAFGHLMLEQFEATNIECESLQMGVVSTNEFLTLNGIATNRTIQTQFGEITTDISANVKPSITAIQLDISGNLLPRLGAAESDINALEIRALAIETDISGNLLPRLGTAENDINTLEARALALETDISGNILPRLGTAEGDINTLETRALAIETDISGNILPRLGTAEGDINVLEAKALAIETDISGNILPRLTTNESDINALEIRVLAVETDISGNIKPRLTTAENDINVLESRTLAVETDISGNLLPRLSTAEGDINTLELRALAIETDISGNLLPRLATAEGDINTLEARALAIETDISSNVKPSIVTAISTCNSYTDNAITVYNVGLNTSTIVRTNVDQTLTGFNRFTRNVELLDVGNSTLMPTQSYHAASKAYVDGCISTYDTSLNQTTIARTNANNNFSGQNSFNGLTNLTPTQCRVNDVFPATPMYSSNHFGWTDGRNYINCDTNVGGRLQVSYNGTFSQNLSVGGNLSVTGATTMTDLSLSNNASVTHNLTVGGNSTTTGTTTTTDLSVSNDVTIADHLTVSGDVSFTSMTASTGITTPQLTLGAIPLTESYFKTWSRPLILGYWYSSISPFANAFPLTCSLKTLDSGGWRDNDDYIFLERGVKFEAFNGDNYVTLLYTFDNTSGTAPAYYEVSSKNNCGSFKIYYYNTEVTFNPTGIHGFS